MPGRVLDQGVLRLFEAVEQRSEIDGSAVHARTLEQAVLKLGIRAQEASTVAYSSSRSSGPGADDKRDYHTARKGSGDTDANDPAEGGGLGKGDIAASNDGPHLSPA